MMFVDRHEDWQAQGGELSHVMGQIAALVLDAHRHPQQGGNSSGRKGGPVALVSQDMTEAGAARKAAGFAAHAQALRTGSISSDAASDLSSEDSFGAAAAAAAACEPAGSSRLAVEAA